MGVRIAAHSDEVCPKCGSCNPNDRQVTVWRVADERGAHFECDVCAASWTSERSPPVGVIRSTSALGR